MKLTKIFGVLLFVIGLAFPLTAQNLINNWTTINRSAHVGFVNSVFSTDHPVGVESVSSQEFQIHSAPGGTITFEKSFNSIPMAGANWFSIWYKPAILGPQGNTALDLVVEVSSNNSDFHALQMVSMGPGIGWGAAFWDKPGQLGNFVTKARINIHVYYGGSGTDTITAHLRLDEFWTSSWGYPVNPIDRFGDITGIEPIVGEIPKEYSLSQNYPNPFNPVTNIKFSIPKREFVTLSIYDALGREMETLISKEVNAGTYVVDWGAGQYASGIYFYRLKAGDFTETKRMTLAK